MAYVRAALTTIQPAFATVSDSDPAVRVLVSCRRPSLTSIAALVAYALRERPHWAAIGFAAVLLHPVVFYVSAWWGQYDSIFVLTGLGALVAALNGRNGLAAGLLAVSLMTKPQAIPFLVPFAAWFWATGGSARSPGRRSASRVIAVLWYHSSPTGDPATGQRPLLLERRLRDPLAPGLEPVVAAPGGGGRRRLHP